jgi:hypothetical protein
MKKMQRKWNVREQTINFKHSENNLSNTTNWTWKYGKICYDIIFKYPVTLIKYLFIYSVLLMHYHKYSNAVSLL